MDIIPRQTSVTSIFDRRVSLLETTNTDRPV